MLARAVVLLALLITGCSARIIPPPHPADPTPVFVTDYGRHSSLILPDGAGDLTEFAYGDWDWFAVNKNKWYNAVGALFWSEGATLGFRTIDAGPTRSDLTQVVGCKSMLRFNAERSKVESLRLKLAARLDSRLDSMVYNPVSGFNFVRDEEHYSLWHNCNHLTAEWLRELGCRIEGNAQTSAFRLRKSSQ